MDAWTDLAFGLLMTLIGAADALAFGLLLVEWQNVRNKQEARR